MTTIALTGASGIVGMELLPRLRVAFPDADLISLVRSPDQVPVRAGETLLKADVTDPGLGATPAGRALAEAELVIHMAADIRFNQEHETALQVNAEGTRRVVEIVRRGPRRTRRFIHVSTAYVEPSNRCTNCTPFVIDQDREFNNSYEHSKWVAERHVLESDLPWTIVRPSLVFSQQQSKIRTRFCGVNLLLEYMARGIMPIAIGDVDALVDTVPDTHVADSLIRCLREELEGRVAVVTAGSQSLPVPAFLEAAAAVLKRARTKAGLAPLHDPVLVECEKYHRLFYPFVAPILRGGKRRQMELLHILHPYFVLKRSFKSTRGAFVFDCPPLGDSLWRGFEEWCSANEKLVRGRPYDWVNSVKPEFRHIRSPLST